MAGDLGGLYTPSEFLFVGGLRLQTEDSHLKYEDHRGV